MSSLTSPVSLFLNIHRYNVCIVKFNVLHICTQVWGKNTKMGGWGWDSFRPEAVKELPWGSCGCQTRTAPGSPRTFPCSSTGWGCSPGRRKSLESLWGWTSQRAAMGVLKQGFGWVTWYSSYSLTCGCQTRTEDLVFSSQEWQPQSANLKLFIWSTCSSCHKPTQPRVALSSKEDKTSALPVPARSITQHLPEDVDQMTPVTFQSIVK